MPLLFRAIFLKLGSLFTNLKYRLELLFIIYPVEGVLRLWYHLDSRVYSEKKRIRRLTDGQRVPQGRRYVLFVFYDRHVVPPFTQVIIDAIARRGLNLVISTNARITPELRAALLEKCGLLIERVDLGRDFGGYKDGISIIEKRFGTPDRLILLNDSLFYLEKGLDEFLAALDGEEPLVAMCEDHYKYYHIQSYALAFDSKVLSHQRFRNYWRKYRPISTRRWAIGKVERGLTRQVLKAGFKPRILYSAGHLMPHLRTRDYGELLEAIQRLPTEERAPFVEKLRDLRLARTVAPLPLLDALSRSVRRIQRIEATGERDLRGANIKEILTISSRSLTLQAEHEEWGIESLGESIVALVGKKNQMHLGGFLFARYLGMPAIKRDIFFRELYPLEEIDEHFDFLPAPIKEEVMADIRQKGTAMLLHGLSRTLYRHGSI